MNQGIAKTVISALNSYVAALTQKSLFGLVLLFALFGSFDTQANSLLYLPS